MHSIVARTFGGLSAPYYFRHLVFGVALTLLLLAMALRGPNLVPLGMLFVLAVNTLLYPYSRFVYEGVVGFIVGDNVFTVPALIALFIKLMTMALCFAGAIFIAPIGLLYLYIRHSRAGRAESPRDA